MGDSGSLTIGLIISILAIKLIDFDVSKIHHQYVLNISKPIFVMAVLVYPLVDTLRIFIYRAVRGLSPFSADRNHLHHRLLDIGCNHTRVVLIIYILNILIIGVPLVFLNLDANYLLLIVGGSALLLAQIPFLISKKRNRSQRKK